MRTEVEKAGEVTDVSFKADKVMKYTKANIREDQ